MPEKFDTFLSGGKLECASGGRPRRKGGFHRHLMACLISLGLMATMLSPAHAFAPTQPHNSPYLRMLDIFQIRLRMLKTPHTIVVIDHDLGRGNIAHVQQRATEEQKKRMRKNDIASATAITHAELSRTANAFAQRHDAQSITFITNKPLPLPLAEKDALLLHPSSVAAWTWAAQRACAPMNIHTGGRWATEPVRLPVRLATATLPTFAEMYKYTLYHEGFGHATEHTQELCAVATGTRETYRRHLQELRAEIAGAAGLAQETGHNRIGRQRARMLDAGCITRILCREETQLPYATLGTGLEKACQKIDATLKDEKKKAVFRKMTDKELVTTIDHLFDAAKPSFSTYEKTLEAAALIAQHGRTDCLAHANASQTVEITKLIIRERQACALLLPPAPQPNSREKPRQPRPQPQKQFR
ncbi:MAG TPA: hypothetical protein DCW68_02190 [Rhodospirillaceae bacterium]|nr:MAG: hypothetical protein A2018_05155 [Alphaproteobacteria bacterium GWF2_58_20]HAU28905.1 hypothetical protein [Rhodospirillaceae bacterium]